MNITDVIAPFLRLPAAERRTTLRVAGEALLVEAMIRVWPLPRVARILGFSLAHADSDVASPRSLTLSAAERRQLRCVRRVMRHWPLCEGTCLRESLLFGRVLRKRKPRLVLGVAPANGSFIAHAWLDIGGVKVGEQDVFQPLVR